MSLKISSFSRDLSDWYALTTERYRIDEHVIDQLASGNIESNVDVSTLLRRCNNWIQNTLFQLKSDAPLRITKHLLDRARLYEGKTSRCGKYIELYENERKVVESLTYMLDKHSVYKIVEIGLNEKGNVCKIALLLPFNQWISEKKSEERKLYLLVGCDGGLKTFYAVPDLKWRKNYQMDSHITSLTLESLSRLAEVIEKEENVKEQEAKKEEEEEEVKKKEDDGWTVVKGKRK